MTKRFIKVIKRNYVYINEIDEMLGLLSFFIGLFIVINWAYVYTRYNDWWLLLWFVPLILSVIIIKVYIRKTNTEVYYEEIKSDKLKRQK